MAYLLINCCDTEKVLQQMDITVKLHYRKDFLRTQKQKSMQLEIQQALEKIAEKYFDSNYESDEVSNNEYGRNMQYMHAHSK